jgi:hypothetical protein
VLSGVEHAGSGVEWEVFDEDGDDAGHGDGDAEGAERGTAGSASGEAQA